MLHKIIIKLPNTVKNLPQRQNFAKPGHTAFFCPFLLLATSKIFPARHAPARLLPHLPSLNFRTKIAFLKTRPWR